MFNILLQLPSSMTITKNEYPQRLEAQSHLPSYEILVGDSTHG